MKLVEQKGSFRKCSEITIPEIFNRRMVTGIARVDRLVGEGFLPGSIFTLTGSPGAGKTTFMLQTLEALAKRGYKVGYASGEECVELLAMTCKRIGVSHIDIANLTHIKDVLKATKSLDMLIVDSFNSLTSDHKSSRQHEKYCVQELCKASKRNECVVGLVLHITKAGTYKGGTIIPHAVDSVMHLHRDMVEGQPDNYVSLSVTKNRFGPTSETQLMMTSAGFDWDAKPPEDKPENQLAPKSARKQEDVKRLLEQKQIDLKKASEILEGNEQRAKYLLWQLTKAGQFTKSGRGDTTVWTRKVKA